MLHGSRPSAFLAALALAACGGEQAEPPPEPEVIDESGELSISEAEAEQIEELEEPGPAVTNVPADEADAASDAPTPAPEG